MLNPREIAEEVRKCVEEEGKEFNQCCLDLAEAHEIREEDVIISAITFVPGWMEEWGPNRRKEKK